MTTRRNFLGSSLVVGCSMAASPLFVPMSFAAVPGDQRLVVILLRGAMDGLDVIQPYGDPELKRLRPGFKIGPETGAYALNNFFALHPGLADLVPLWRAGHLAFAHAVSTPYRDKRSHFDGQDLLEAGTLDRLPVLTSQSGWLNRLMARMPRVSGETAYVLGTDPGLILNGPRPANAWNPAMEMTINDSAFNLLMEVAKSDPLFRESISRAVDISRSYNRDGAGSVMVQYANFAADRLKRDSRIVTFTIGGWDTHVNQSASLMAPLKQLSDAILTLRSQLGSLWSNTTILAMTEFGRTAAMNGSNGTDHGTGGALIMAGGTLNGGKVYGKWPGLVNLYANRDLLPTQDIREYPGWAIHKLYGVPKSVVESEIFPGIKLGADPKFIA